jgi:protein-tyrosine-phosphatase
MNIAAIIAGALNALESEDQQHREIILDAVIERVKRIRGGERICAMSQRLDRIAAMSPQTSEKLLRFHPRNGSDVCQITLMRDCVEPQTGTGQTFCAALNELEKELNLAPPQACWGCEMG